MLAGTGDPDAMPAESHEASNKLIAGETVSARADGDLAGIQIQRWHGPPARCSYTARTRQFAGMHAAAFDGLGGRGPARG